MGISVRAFAPVLQPVAAGFAPVTGPPPTTIRLGTTFGRRDNARLLDGLAAARAAGGRVALVHHGAGGGSLVRCAVREDPGLDGITIELPARPSSRALRAAETHAATGAGGDEVVVDNVGTVSRTGWRAVDLPPLPRPAPIPGAVVVTGGLGGLGLAVAGALARRHGLHPVLLDVAGTREVAGASVHTVDITEAAAVRRALARVPEPVVGVVHCAGTLRGGPVALTTADDLAAVQAAKVTGLRHVLAAVDPAPIRYLIVFGSVTAEEPHRDLGCYALANELLRRAALRAAARLPNAATVVAQWSVWGGAGMAYEMGAVEQARRLGMRPIALRAGISAVLRLMAWPAGPRHATRLNLRGPG